MAVDLNTASRDILLWAGLTPAEVKRIQQFKKDNAVFHTKAELKQHCDFSSSRYEQIKHELTAHHLQGSQYGQEVSTRKYRRKRGDMRDDWDVGHIIARANGGADHPANYAPMARDYNRKLQNLHDGVIFAHLSDEKLREAVRASRVQNECPLTFNEALQKKHDALHNMKELKLFREGWGQVEETDGSMEDKLCDAEYCERLVREWNEKTHSD